MVAGQSTLNPEISMSNTVASSIRHLTSSRSSTATVVEQLEIYGYHPANDEIDPRPFPEAETLDGVIANLFETLTEPLADTALEPDLQDLLWSLTDLFHRKAGRVQRMLDTNEMRQKQSQADQDGSEIRSTDLERLIAQGQALLERRNVYEIMRDRAGEHFETHTGSSWLPRSGSKVNHRNQTAAMVDSRDFISAKHRAETEVMIPAGTKVAFTGGYACKDVNGIWATLDKALAKYPDMVLLHTGGSDGADKIAACWAAQRKVTPIRFMPHKTHAADRSAPFRRNDELVETMPLVLIVYPGNGITDNLADKAKARGIRLYDCRKPTP